MQKKIHLTEGQLYQVIKDVLNELDYKTYDWAANHALDTKDAFIYAIKNKDYSNPLARKAIIRYLAKKYKNRKDIIPLINGMSDEQLSQLMNMLQYRKDIRLDLDKLSDKFANAARRAFANKYGHKVIKTYDTIDQEGNVWMPDLHPSSYLKQYRRHTGRGLINFKNDPENACAFISNVDSPIYNNKVEPYWYIFKHNGPVSDKEKEIIQSDAAQDLLNHYKDNYEYVKGKGWQLKQKNESLARRVTENIIKKLRRA